jgi:prevent-host-death family protein
MRNVTCQCGHVMKVSAAKFKATCLRLMDRVAATGEEIIITKHGAPVAKLVAAKRQARVRRSVHGCMKGTILYSAPIDALYSTGETWNTDERS